MKKLFYLFFFIFSFYNIFCFGQSLKTSHASKALTPKAIDEKLEEIRFNPNISDPEKERALFILKSNSENIGYKWGILKSGRRIIEIYEKQNKNKEIIKLATELKRINAGPEAYRTMANLYRSNALALGYLGLDEASLKDFKTAIKYAEKITDPNIKNYTLALLYEQLTIYFTNKKLENKTYKDSIKSYHNKSLEVAKLIKDNDKEITTENKYGLISFNYLRLGILYLEEADKPGNVQIAEKYLTKSLNITNKFSLVNADKVVLLNQLSWLYLEKKDYKKTIEYANLALDLEKQFPNANNRVESFEFLASAYTEMGDNKNAKLYMDKYSILKDSIRVSEKNDADQSFNILLSESKQIEDKKSWIKIMITSVISFLLLIGLTFYWRRRNKIIHKKYEELMLKIKNEKETKEDLTVLPEDIQNTDENKSSVSMTDETINTLLLKLEKFEKSNKYLRKDISLAWLATSFNTNTKYLSEIIKVYKNKSFTSYINGLRIDYVIRKLASDPQYREYKISYLADECGYASSQVFNIAFKKETGFTPSYFIENLKKDNFLELKI